MDYLISKIKGLHISGGSGGVGSSVSANSSPSIENNVKLSQLFDLPQENVLSDHENMSPQEITLPPQIIFQSQTSEIHINEVGFFYNKYEY